MYRLDDKRLCKRCGEPFSGGKLQCPSCMQWHILEKPVLAGANDGSVLLSESTAAIPKRYKTGPWDASFGGGIVSGSTTLLGGEPGAGKSTLTMQLADALAKATEKEIIYVAAEQSLSELSLFAKRLKLSSIDKFRIVPVREGFDGDISGILLRHHPGAIVVDSIPGLVGHDLENQVELCKRFKDYAIELNAPAILIQHVTKGGDMAGLMALQHEVDVCMLFFCHESGSIQRHLQPTKNRLGDTLSVCLEMTDRGLIECDGCEYCENEGPEAA